MSDDLIRGGQGRDEESLRDDGYSFGVLALSVVCGLICGALACAIVEVLS